MNKKNSDYIFGIRPVIEALKAGRDIDRLFIRKGTKNDSIQEIIKLAETNGIPWSMVPKEKLNRITKKNHQGCICYLSPISFYSIDNVISETYGRGEDPFLLLLDRITDVRNFGAIARTVECAGINAIVIPKKGSALISSDAIKTSAGALNYVPVCREGDFKDTIRFLQENGIKVVACSERSDKTIYNLDLTGPVALLMGSEENGIQPELLKLTDSSGKIPMKGSINSLNVSVSAALAIYEVLRQRGL